MIFEFFLTGFWKIFKSQFRIKPSSERRVVPCGQTDGGTDVTKLIAAFRNFANAPKSQL